MGLLKRGDKVGYAFLMAHLGLLLPPLSREAIISPVTAVTATLETLQVPVSVAPLDDSILAHVQFALKHEGTNLGVLRLALPHLDADEFLLALQESPSSGYLRIVGYLYEAFTGRNFEQLPVLAGGYADIFDATQYYTGPQVKHPRWRVNFNGIGSIEYCPVVRKSAEIEALRAVDILGQLADFYAKTDHEIMDRALSWAYLSETEGSFALERETPQEDKKSIFVQLLQQAHEPRVMNEDYLVELQNSVVSNPYDHAMQYRTEQNWLRRRGVFGPTGVNYIPPKPDDAARMMDSLLALLNQRPAGIDPIMLGAVISFGFVFIHPFMDGNGRLSRFLMHYALCQSAQLQKGLMLPISVAMKRNENEYLAALQGFSRPTRALWRVHMQDEERFECTTESDDTMYRYWDATDCVHFIYRMALNSLEKDLAAETKYLAAFDAAYRMVDERWDLRDHDLNNLIMWCSQNKGLVSKKRREQLAHRYQDEVFDAVELAVKTAFVAESEADESEGEEL
nr:Fic family protein [uncultured Deefgea sp.]